MAITTFGTGAAGIVKVGPLTTATAWGGISGGTRVTCTGGFYTQIDVLFTAASIVSLGAYYSTGASSLLATLLDATGVTTLGTITPTLVTSTFIDTPVPLFAGLTEGTTYWLRLRFDGNSNQLLCSANFLQFTTTTIATISTPPNYGTVYTFGTAIDGTNIVPRVGLEGGIQNVVFQGWNTLKNTTPLGTPTNNSLIRFKAQCDHIWLYQYESGYNYHLNRLLLNGSGGVPLDAGQTLRTTSATNTAGWKLLAGTLDNTNSYLYEIAPSNTGSNMLLYAIMTSGGSGIDTSVVGSTLVRPLDVAVTGDSIEAGVTSTTGLSGYGAWGLYGQDLNVQVLNVAVPGISLQTLSAGNQYQDLAACGVPREVVIGAGINDYKSGSPPTASQLSGYGATFIKKIRTNSGFSAVPVWDMAMLPYSGTTYALEEPFNSGTNGYSIAVVAAFNAGTISGQSPSPDPNVFYMNRSSLAFAGAWNTGGAFNGTNYDGDGLHPNCPISVGNPGTGYRILANYYESILAAPATTYVISLPASGGISVPISGSITPNGNTTDTVSIAVSPAGVTITPNPITLTGTTPVAFTATGTVLGAHTLTPTNSGTMSNPSPFTYTVVTVSVTYGLDAVRFGVVGVGTGWTGTPFSIISGGGVMSAQVVDDTTHAHFTITGGGPTWVISDGYEQFTVKASATSGGGGGGSITGNFIFNGTFTQA